MKTEGQHSRAETGVEVEEGHKTSAKVHEFPSAFGRSFRDTESGGRGLPGAPKRIRGKPRPPIRLRNMRAGKDDFAVFPPDHTALWASERREANRVFPKHTFLQSEREFWRGEVVAMIGFRMGYNIRMSIFLTRLDEKRTERWG